MSVLWASVFYGITIGAGIIAVLASFFQRAGKTQRYLIMSAFLVLLLAMGRWLYVNSDGLSSILVARKIINFTGCWLWFFIFLFITLWMCAGITDTSLMHFFLIFHHLLLNSYLWFILTYNF